MTETEFDSSDSLWRWIALFLLVSIIGIYLLYEWYDDRLTDQIAEQETALLTAEDALLEAQAINAALQERIQGLEGQASEREQSLLAEVEAAKAAHEQLNQQIDVLRSDSDEGLAAAQEQTARAHAAHEETKAQLADLQATHAQAQSRVEELEAEFAQLQRAIAESTAEHQAQVEQLEKHLNERVNLARATPADTELLRAAQHAGLLPMPAPGADAPEDNVQTAAGAELTALREQLAAREATVETLQRELEEAREAHADALAAAEEQIASLTAQLAQASTGDGDDAQAALQEGLARAEASQEQLRAEHERAIEALKAAHAQALETAEVQVAELTAQLEQGGSADGTLAEVQERLQQAEAAHAQTQAEAESALQALKEAHAGEIESAEARIAALAEQLEQTPDETQVAALKEQLEASEAEVARLQSDRAQALEAAKAAQADELEALRTRLAAAEADLQAAETAVAESRKTAAGLRDLYAQFALLGGRHTEAGMLLNLPDTELRFQPGAATLPDEELPALDQVTALLEQHPGLSIRVEGHTDSLGADEVNMTLSQQRADAVRDALIARGIAADRVTAEGLGSSRPIADNATWEGRSRNRRVELYVIEGEAG